MWWMNLPVVSIPEQTTQEPMTTGQVFRSETLCPIPREWLFAAFIGGLALGYVIWNR